VTLLVGTEDGLHELDESSGPVGVHLAGHSIGCLAPEGSGWWALTDGEALWHSAHPGAWDQAATASGQRLNCLCPTAAGLLVGAEEATLLLLKDEKLQALDAFDQVPGRDTWYTPWGGPPDVRSISEEPGRAIYVNVHVGGVVRSTDGGKTFHPTIDMDTDVHQVLAPSGRPGLVLAATGAEGLAVSTDGGESWSFVTDGLHASYSRAVAVGDTALLASASTGPRGGKAAVYRRSLAAVGPFVKCTEGLPEWFSQNIDTFCLAASGTRAAFGTNEGSVFISEDEGQIWRPLVEGLPGVRCLAFADRLSG
jgi:hypothetical protein